MKTYNDLINERLSEPWLSKVRKYSIDLGRLYDFVSEEDLTEGLGFLLTLFNFNKTPEGFDFWFKMMDNYNENSKTLN